MSDSEEKKSGLMITEHFQIHAAIHRIQSSRSDGIPSSFWFSCSEYYKKYCLLLSVFRIDNRGQKEKFMRILKFIPKYLEPPLLTQSAENNPQNNPLTTR